MDPGYAEARELARQCAVHAHVQPRMPGTCCRKRPSSRKSMPG